MYIIFVNAQKAIIKYALDLAAGLLSAGASDNFQVLQVKSAAPEMTTP
jgi:hypothetical protein